MNGPWRCSLVMTVVMALVLAACGGPGGGPGGGDGNDSDLPDRAAASSDDAEGTTYALQSGRYRLSYRAPGCDEVVVSIQQIDGDFSYEQRPRGFTSFINDVPAGEYEITVTSDCDEWTINLNRF